MKLTILKQADKFYQRLPKSEQQRLKSAIRKLPQGDVKPLEGEQSSYRLRVGKWRVLYQIAGDEIIIREIGSRGDIYKS